MANVLKGVSSKKVTPHPAQHLVVLPGMFPRYPGDIYGIFVYDYLTAVRSRYNISVVAGQLKGDKKHRVEHREEMAIHQFSIVSRFCPKWFRMLLYPAWFIYSWRILNTLGRVGLVHAHRVAIEGTLACLYAKWRKVPAVVTVHTGPFSKLLKHKIARMLTRWVLERADAVLVVSEDLKQQILDSGIQPARMLVTYNPVDTDLFVPALDHADSSAQPNILFAGRFESYKGAMRTLRAFLKVSQVFKEWTLTLVGEGPEFQAIQQFIQQHPELETRVKLTGKQSKKQIARLKQG